MINPSDSIEYTNVISRKYSTKFGYIDALIKEFLDDIGKLNVSVRGPLFYSIINFDKNETMEIEIFMPVKEDYVNVMDDMYFHSYYSVEDMVSCSIYSDFENTTKEAYKMIADYISKNNLKQVTPIYHIVSGDRTLQYVIVKVGAASL